MCDDNEPLAAPIGPCVHYRDVSPSDQGLTFDAQMGLRRSGILEKLPPSRANGMFFLLCADFMDAIVGLIDILKFY